jgi:hypothetical protein
MMASNSAGVSLPRAGCRRRGRRRLRRGHHRPVKGRGGPPRAPVPQQVGRTCTRRTRKILTGIVGDPPERGWPMTLRLAAEADGWRRFRADPDRLDLGLRAALDADRPIVLTSRFSTPTGENARTSAINSRRRGCYSVRPASTSSTSFRLVLTSTCGSAMPRHRDRSACWRGRTSTVSSPSTCGRPRLLSSSSRRARDV